MHFLHSGAFWRGPGATLEAPGTLPDQISNKFSGDVWHVPSGSCVCCRVPPGCCRDTPPTSGTHSPGCFWGTAISRRGAGVVLDGCFKSAKVCRSRKGFPSLPSRRPPQDRRPLPCKPDGPLFFRFFSIFFACKKTSKKRNVKNSLFSPFLAILGGPGVAF